MTTFADVDRRVKVTVDRWPSETTTIIELTPLRVHCSLSGDVDDVYSKFYHLSPRFPLCNVHFLKTAEYLRRCMWIGAVKKRRRYCHVVCLGRFKNLRWWRGCVSSYGNRWVPSFLVWQLCLTFAGFPVLECENFGSRSALWQLPKILFQLTYRIARAVLCADAQILLRL